MRTWGWVQEGLLHDEVFLASMKLYAQPGGEGQSQEQFSVGPVGGVSVAGLAALGLLLHAA